MYGNYGYYTDTVQYHGSDARHAFASSIKLQTKPYGPLAPTLQKKQARNWARYCLVVRNCITRLVRGEFK